MRTLRQLIDQIPGCVKLPQRQLVMVLVIEHVEQVAVKGVDVFYFGEVLQDLGKLLMPISCCKLHFAHVKLADTLDCPSIVHDCGRLPLSFGQDNIYEIFGSGHHLHGLKVVGRHDGQTDVKATGSPNARCTKYTATHKQASTWAACGGTVTTLAAPNDIR